MTCNISKPGPEEEYGLSHALWPFHQAGREKTPRENLESKDSGNFLILDPKMTAWEWTTLCSWLTSTIGQARNRLICFFFFLTLYIWGLITIIAACIKLNKTLFIILKFMTVGKFLMPNPRESHFIYDLLNYNIMDYEKCSLHIYFVYNENT